MPLKRLAGLGAALVVIVTGLREPRNPPEDRRHAPPSPESVAARYELTDMSARLLLGLGIAMLGASVIMHAGLGAYLKWLKHHPDATRPAAQVPPPLVAARPAEPPPPRLQKNPAEDLAALRNAQTQVLGSYGWVDRKQGIARIPIERAMELYAEQLRGGAR